MEVLSETFFGLKMHLLLPSSTDIYLTGGKSHESETRLARFMINHLEPGDTFVDVGAHYGYFTLLGSKLVGPEGKVFTFEASPTTFNILDKNTCNRTNIKSFNLAVADEVSKLTFYEFPNLYSEYNTLDVNQFRSANWFSQYKPREVTIQTIVLDQFLSEHQAYPKMIKIDVEGAELKVINGLSNYLSEHSPLLVMEYLSQERGNEQHQEAVHLLNALGYLSYTIDGNGNLNPIKNINDYLNERKLESDNLVFLKKAKAINGVEDLV